MNKQSSTLSSSINSIESGNFCQVREDYPVKEVLLISVCHVQEDYPVQEGLPNSVSNSLLTNCVQPLEGVCSFDVQSNELFNQFNCINSVVNYPLDGVRISAQNLNRSASSWLNSLVVTFPACFLNCWPVWIFVWISTVYRSNLGHFLILFLFHINFWTYWCLFFLFGSSIFQTVEMDFTNNDSFEQLLNQFVPVIQRWFSSDRARPRFRAGAAHPNRQTSAQRAMALKGQYARILANFRSRRLQKFGPLGRFLQPVLSLDILKSPVVAPDRKSLPGLVRILDSDVLSELIDEDPSLRLKKRALINRDYEGFCRVGAYLKSFCLAVCSSSRRLCRCGHPDCYPKLPTKTSSCPSSQVTCGSNCHGGCSSIYLVASDASRCYTTLYRLSSMYEIW